MASILTFANKDFLNFVLENSVAPDDFLFHSTTKPILPSLQPSISSWNSTSISATEIIPSINSVSLNVGPIFHNTHTTIVYPILINTLTNLTETNTQLPLTLLPATAALIVSSTITSPNYHVTAIHPSLPQITLPAGIATPQFTPITESSMGQHQLPAYRLCQDTKSNLPKGKIQPRDYKVTGRPTSCSFTIRAPADRRIEMSCTVVKLVSLLSSLRLFDGIDLIADAPVVNRCYTSIGNVLLLKSRVANADWFECKWSTVKL